ncbi:MAG TPA: GNAT family N-acetyltransferase [Longimicrobiales bacterium]|nr:GNAT family N-acetyltransferase [Longimicrobiales bacterium]
MRTTSNGTGGRSGERGADTSLRIEPVSSRAELRAFLRLPWRIYRHDSHWVPPLLVEQRKLLNRRRHPFHRHADVEYFLARRNERVVGRIAAIVNHRHVEFHGELVGFFGFFECEDDPAAARGLIGRAEDWLAARGMRTIRGPMSFSTNEECGLLIDGFDTPPMIMTTHNPAYYERLLEAAGLRKAKDLLAYLLSDIRAPERLLRGVARMGERAGAIIRPIRMKELPREIERVREIYNSAWERNWGFVPMTGAEFDEMAKQMKQIIDPELCLIAEIDGEAVGFELSLPDFNQAIRHANGRLLPFGIFKLLWHARHIDQARVITLGVKPAYRRLGLDAMMTLRAYRRAVELGYRRSEASWILEDNLPTRRILERLGWSVYKTYRVYDKPLHADS